MILIRITDDCRGYDELRNPVGSHQACRPWRRFCTSAISEGFQAAVIIKQMSMIV